MLQQQQDNNNDDTMTTTKRRTNKQQQHNNHNTRTTRTAITTQQQPKDTDLGTYNDCSHPSVMTCFRNNISPDVMKFIGVLWMVKGVGLSGVTAKELLCIAVAVYLLKRKGEALPKSNSAFYLLKEQDPDKWENFKAWNLLKSTPKFLEA